MKKEYTIGNYINYGDSKYQIITSMIDKYYKLDKLEQNQETEEERISREKQEFREKRLNHILNKV